MRSSRAIDATSRPEAPSSSSASRSRMASRACRWLPAAMASVRSPATPHPTRSNCTLPPAPRTTLQRRWASRRFSGASIPPADTGIRWSTLGDQGSGYFTVRRTWRRQRWQRQPSRIPRSLADIARPTAAAPRRTDARRRRLAARQFPQKMKPALITTSQVAQGWGVAPFRATAPSAAPLRRASAKQGALHVFLVASPFERRAVNGCPHTVQMPAARQGRQRRSPAGSEVRPPHSHVPHPPAHTVSGRFATASPGNAEAPHREMRGFLTCEDQSQAAI